MARLTTEEFIRRAKEVHGDRWDYSQSVYTGCYNKVKIICREHGPFYQLIGNHLKGCGCLDCGNDSSSKKQASSKEEFIRKARAVHGKKHNYDEAVYVNNATPVKIICPIHGAFWQIPTVHIYGRSDCPKCATNTMSEKLSMTTAEFIEKANKVHNHRYSYPDDLKYTNAHTKVKIICPIHGGFWQDPDAHLHGFGCAECGFDKTKKALSMNTAEFIDIANSIHCEAYEYNNAKYINMHTKVEITCPIHGPFMQTPMSHIHLGCGCPNCAKSGFKSAKPAILYYLEIDNGGQKLYKIGITNNTVTSRFKKSDLELITVLATHEYKIGSDAFKQEQEILKEYKQFKYGGPPILSSGNTELFTENILNL